MKSAGTFAIPTWAVNAIEYWDFSGLDDLDTELVQSFIDANFKHGFVVDWRGIWQSLNGSRRCRLLSRISINKVGVGNHSRH